MRKRLLAAVLTLCLGTMTGCRTINKEITKPVYSKNPEHVTVGLNESWKYELTDSKLQEVNFAGIVKVGDTEVSYQKGLETQANYIAKQIDELLSHVQESTGLQIPYKTKIFLIRLDRMPQNYSVNFKVKANEFGMPLFVEAGKESSTTIISQNVLYPYMFTHEVVEMSLFWPKNGGRVLPDPAWEWCWFKANVRNYTRWFREGLANYAGYIAYKTIQPEIDTKIALAERRRLHEHPFSSLSKVGKKLFKWHQYSDDGLDTDYYSAALGLFLLIRDKFGEDAIKEIVLEVKKHQYLDGQDLAKITNKVLNVNIKKLAESFRFPETGLKMEPLTEATAMNKGYTLTKGLLVTSVEPNSLAERAEIKKGDVILKIDGKPVEDNLDFELVIFKVMEQQNCKVLIWREGQTEVTLKLQLKN